MTNITPIAKGKQVTISEHQIQRLIDFVKHAQDAFDQLQVLSCLMIEKGHKGSTSYTLAQLTADKSMDWSENCDEELEFFKEFSPEVAQILVKELAA